MPRYGTSFISDAEVGGRGLLRSTAVVAEDRHGAVYQFTTHRTLIERSGSMGAVIRLDGHFVDRYRRRWLDGTMRLHFFAGLGTVKVEFSVTNPRAARHPGGTWDLGDHGSVLIRDLSIAIVPAKGGADVWASLDAGDHMGPAGARFSVHQESSGGAEWQHHNHVNRDNVVAARFRGFRAERDGREVKGLRAAPIVSIGGGDARVSVAMPRFWEIFPKAIEADVSHCPDLRT